MSHLNDKDHSTGLKNKIDSKLFTRYKYHGLKAKDFKGKKTLGHTN